MTLGCSFSRCALANVVAPSFGGRPDILVHGIERWSECRRRPCLQRALQRGDFRHSSPNQQNPADMKRVCSVAHDIASGMASLHKRDVVHGGACTTTGPCCTLVLRVKLQLQVYAELMPVLTRSPHRLKALTLPSLRVGRLHAGQVVTLHDLEQCHAGMADWHLVVSPT